MERIHPEPINQLSGHIPLHHGWAAGTGAQPMVRPANIDALIAMIQREFPNAHIRITGRGRTVQRQAELMADRRRRNRHQFLHTYRAASHITEMDRWVTNHPQASEQETVTAFVEIINRARRNGAVVSNHLSDRARDISIPVGDHHLRDRVRDRLRELGAHVIDEADAVGGPHWHTDY